MKRIVFISAVLLGLGIVSCQKQEIVPTSDGKMIVPTWDESLDNAENERSLGGTNTHMRGSDDDNDHGHVPGSGSTGSTDDGDITDPNIDPDAD